MISVLARNWRECGLEPGDTILVHCSLKRTLQERDTTPQAVMESFLEAVAPGASPASSQSYSSPTVTALVQFPPFAFTLCSVSPESLRQTATATDPRTDGTGRLARHDRRRPFPGGNVAPQAAPPPLKGWPDAVRPSGFLLCLSSI